MSLLPFSRLPLLAQLEIIRYAEFPDLFRLATCSKKVAKIIRQANISLRKFGIKMYEDQVLFNFQFPNTECDYEIAVDRDFREWMGENRLFMRESMDSSGNQWRLDIRVREKEFHVVAGEILRFLLKQFKCTELSYLMVKPSENTKNMMEDMIKPYFSTVQLLSCVQDQDSKPLTREQFEWVLDCITVTKLFTSECEVDTEVLYCEGFQADIVKIKHSNWVDLDSILNSTAKHLNFTRYALLAQPMNLILKAWISKKKLINLKKFHTEVLVQYLVRSMYMDRVMEGIQEAILTPEEQKHFDEQEIRDVVKIIRRVDGRLAALSVNQLAVSLNVL